MDDRHVSDADVRRIEREEELITELQYLIQEAMNERGLTRADMAHRLGISKPRMTQLLGDSANPTLRTLVAVFDAMDEEIRIARVKPAAKQALPASALGAACDWGAAETYKPEITAEPKSQPPSGGWEAMLKRADNGWHSTIDPVSNDNWGNPYDEQLVASI